MITTWVRSTALSVAVQAEIEERLYLGRLPQTPTLPAVVFREVKGPEPQSWQYEHGVGSSGMALYVRRFRFTVHSEDAATAYEVAELLEDAIVGQRGTTDDGIIIRLVLWVNNYDSWEDNVEEYMRHLEVEIWHTQRP